MSTRFRTFLTILTIILFSATFFTRQTFAFHPRSTPIVLQDQPLRFIIYYNGNVSAVMNDKDSYLRTFMAIYNLELINTFEVDDVNKGFTLEASKIMELPNEIAKELSLIDDVLMIEVVHPILTKEA